MKLLRFLLVAVCASAGLVLFTQVPAIACSCAATSVAGNVRNADVVFVGVLHDVEQTNPGAGGVISSGDPVFYSFEVAQTFKGDPRDAVVESVRGGETCGLEGMAVGQDYVVFAGQDGRGGLGANLCGGTGPASDRLIDQVEAALAAVEPPTPATQAPLPTEVTSGASTPADPEAGVPPWAWFGAGVLLAMVGGVILDRAGRSRS